MRSFSEKNILQVLQDVFCKLAMDYSDLFFSPSQSLGDVPLSFFRGRRRGKKMELCMPTTGEQLEKMHRGIK